MSRRMEIELTSDRGDGSWTWRAAGAKQPKGVVDAGLVPDGSKVGDVVRAEVEVELEGITVLTLGAAQTRDRKEPERIELVGSGRRDDEELVTTRLVSKGRGDRDRGNRRDRPPRSDGDGPSGDRRDRKPRPEGDRREGAPRGRRPAGDRPDRRPRHPAPPPLPERPKPKRLRPGRAHRKAVLAELPPEHQPIAEEVLRGGIPGVRQAIEAENDKRKAAGEAAIDGKELLRIAEQLLPRMRTAEWHDRADAALADGDELDLRDLRSVVVAADGAARDEETRDLARQLREKLDARLVSEQAQWLEDLQLAVDAGRIVRALRDSSRPPKAGTMLPPDLRLALLGGANAALTAEATADRWSAVLDAIAHSPVRTEVAPVSTPDPAVRRAPRRREALRQPRPQGGRRLRHPAHGIEHQEARSLDAPARARPAQGCGAGARASRGRRPGRPRRRRARDRTGPRPSRRAVQPVAEPVEAAEAVADEPVTPVSSREAVEAVEPSSRRASSRRDRGSGRDVRRGGRSGRGGRRARPRRRPSRSRRPTTR